MPHDPFALSTPTLHRRYSGSSGCVSPSSLKQLRAGAAGRSERAGILQVARVTPCAAFAPESPFGLTWTLRAGVLRTPVFAFFTVTRNN